jgi:methionyl aminopeptidase
MKKFRGVFIKNEREIALLREANGIVAAILDELASLARPGVPTMLFEDVAQKMCRDRKVRPSFQGYNGFPFALCCSVNETVVHGFPSASRFLQEGDLVSFDMGVVYQGFHGDSARTVAVGKVSEEAARLSRVTEECLRRGIAAARPGNDVLSISAAVQSHAEAAGFHVIRRFVGHGVGVSLHESPEIPNFVPPGMSAGEGLPLKPGMVLAIEPMLAVGTSEVTILPDGWTANTADGSLSAHWEHSVVIGSAGTEILSLSR